MHIYSFTIPLANLKSVLQYLSPKCLHFYRDNMFCLTKSLSSEHLFISRLFTKLGHLKNPSHLQTHHLRTFHNLLPDFHLLLALIYLPIRQSLQSPTNHSSCASANYPFPASPSAKTPLHPQVHIYSQRVQQILRYMLLRQRIRWKIRNLIYGGDDVQSPPLKILHLAYRWEFQFPNLYRVWKRYFVMSDLFYGVFYTQCFVK